MFTNQGIVQPLDGTPQEMEAVNGGLEPLNPDGQMPVAATDSLAAGNTDVSVNAGATSASDVEIAMSVLDTMPEDQGAGLKFSVSMTKSASAPEAENAVLSSDTQIRQALGIHKANVDSTDFLARNTGDDFGMSELLDSAAFSAERGDDLAGRKIEDDVEWEGLAWFRNSPEDESLLVLGTVDFGDMDEDTTMLITEAGLLAKAYAPGDSPLSVADLHITDGSGALVDNGDGTWTFTPVADWNGNVALSYRISDGTSSVSANAAFTVTPVNDAPVIAVNDALLVDDLTAQSLAGSLTATDVDNDASDLGYTITQGPVSGVLLLDGVEITDFSQPVFTQADLDNGRVSFRFNTPQPGDETRVIEDDSFVFTVDDGSLSTAETTFHIHNSTVQVWGTNEADDLTGAADFSREGVTFHVYGFDGNDTMRGGSGADTLDGGGHTYAQHSPWLYTQEGGDTVDYGASSAAVDIDLTREAQSGGHAEGDVLIGVENVVGSGFNDNIAGDAAANLFSGLGGNDTLLGLDGNDTLRGGAGTDLIDGGVGQDFADYRTSASWVAVDLNIQDGTAQSGGGADNDALGDTLIGIENLIGSNDAAHGDVLTGNAVNNHLIGLDGNDTLIAGAGNDTLVGGAGADRQDGGAGARDLADYSASTEWVNVDLNLQDGTTAQSGGGAGNHAEGDILTGIEDVNGSAYGDSILGSTTHNVIFSYGGNDTIFAGNGYDTVHGGDGEDFIDGGGHADELYGDIGNDTVYGGNSIDTIWGGAGDDVIYGYRSDGGSDGNQDLLLGGTGNDTLISLSTGRSTLIGCQGADRIMGSGVDEVSYEVTDDYFTVNYGQSVYVDLRIQDGVTAQSGGTAGNDAIGDVLTGIRHIVGAYGIVGDTLIGNDDANEIYGLDGHDLIIGGGGNDTIWGNDHNDTLEGGTGGDLLWGGMHHDVISYVNAAQGVRIDLRNQCNYAGQVGVAGGEEVGDQLWYVDGVIGSAHDDTLIGGSVGDEALATPGWGAYREAANNLEGGAGDDLLMGLGAADTLDGGEGSDTADYSLSEAEVLVDLNLATAQTGGGEVTETPSSIDGSNPGIFYGGNHARGDVLISIENVTGSAYGDTLIGNGEDNVLSGLAGADSITGGGGSDTADYGASASGVKVDLNLQDGATAQTGGEADNHAEGDVLTGMENVTGSAHADTLVGDAGVNILSGLDGDDVITAGAGDTVDGGAGTDVLFSGDANLDIATSTHITGIERVDLTGDAVSLTVNGDAILDNAVADPLGGSAKALIVNGDVGDVVHLSSDTWTWHVASDSQVLADGKTYNVYEGDKGGDQVRLYVESTVPVDSDLDDRPVVDVNGQLGVHDTATATLTSGVLHALDTDNSPAELSYTITSGLEYCELTVDGVLQTDYSNPVFTQEDINQGLVSFRFVPRALDTAQAFTDDTFTFTVSDGTNTTSPHTFTIRNDTVQVWSTNAADDLTLLNNYNDPASTFHVYGFDGNDTMRGGSGADTLDGGGQTYTQHSPWLYTQEGGDTVDYGASSAAVDIDLTREAQTGGHAEGDVLIGVENVLGSSFNDNIAGDAVANLFSGLGGNDTLLGMDGNDTLRGGAGTDLIDGGVGQDFADYRTSASWVNVDLNIQDGTTAQSGGGTDNDALGDTLVGIENLIGSNDATHGDVLTGDALNNHLIGLDGDDTLIGNAGNDTFVGGAGADVLSGGTGTRDLADYSASTEWVNVDLNLQDGTTAQSGGGAGNHAQGDILTGIECVNGSAHDDSILGNTVDNVIFSYGGDDTVFAGNGYDTVNGGAGEDFIDGGGHADELYGGDGNDTLYGGNSIDTIWGGAGDDVLYGYRSDGGSDGNQDLLLGGTGNDTLVSLSTGRSTLIGCQGADRIMGGGADNVSYEVNDDYFTVNYGKSVYVDLRIQDGVTAQSGGEEGNDAIGDVLTGIRYIVGTYAISGDTLIGDDHGNEIYGMDGHDLIIGGGGNDTIWGYDHNDTLEGGAGADLLWGGMDFDMVSYRNASQGVSIDLRNQCNYAGQVGVAGGEEVGDQLWYVDGVIGSAHADTLIGGSVGDEAFATPGWRAYREAANRLEGGAGDDLLMGLGAADTLDGGEGSDTADYSLSEAEVLVDLNLTTAQTGGGEVTETPSSIDGSNPGIFYGGNHARGDVLISIENVTGSAFNDTLIGNGEDNVLSGLAGADSLIGGGGNDTLIGGAGNDTFQGGDGTDLIHAGAGDVVDGGAGSDTLVSEDEYLDVASSTAITGVERIDLTGVGKELSVGGDAILLNGVADPAGSGLMALVVNGDAGDSVVRLADGGWAWTLVATDATVGGDGLTYTLYEASMAGQTVRLYIETGLNEIELTGGVYQILGTEGHDDLTTVWDFTDSRHPFDIQGLGGDDTLLGGPSADTLAGGAGSDLMDGAAGADMAGYSSSPTWVNVDLNLQDGATAQSGGGTDNHASGDTLLGFAGVIGSNDTSHGDVLTGDGQANLLVGLDGDDSLVGGAGNDTLVGGLGYDTLIGGDGDDWFVDGVGSYDTTYTGDSLVGGDGIDTVDYSHSLDVCMVDLTDPWYSFPNSSSSDAYCDTLVGIENIIGSQWFDSLLGDDGANMISGGGYWDYILGRGGDDTLLGGTDNDTIYGGAGNDFIDGGTGNDVMDGGDGDDLLVGGMTDTIDGGAGFDTFRLEDNIGTGSTLDLSAMNDAGRITGIERIDITGDADDASTLTLRAEDVFEVSGGSLYIDGDAGDSVTTIGAGWTQEAGDVSFDGQTYHHYTALYDAQTVNLYAETGVAYLNE
jgi:Ca2+-binding RTX toxin-like protein